MTTSVHDEAVLVILELARAFNAALAALTASSFFFRAEAFWVSLPESEVQDMMVVMAASSNFRHFPNVFLHFLRAFVMAVASAEALQTLLRNIFNMVGFNSVKNCRKWLDLPWRPPRSG